MRLDREEIVRLLALVAVTREDEVDCDACLADLAEFAESELLGADLPVALGRVEEHLAGCGECAEEYAVLREVMRSAPAGAS
jgi:predicted anti-sigma-YlaC factor YlaD